MRSRPHPPSQNPGKGSVSKLPIFARDDENDTHLFNRWQELVVRHCPNPERIGCFDHETLRTFVESPEKLDLTDPKYIHVTECAECTLELQELRALRAERLRQASARKTGPICSRWLGVTAIAASMVVVAILTVMSLRNHAGTSGNGPQDDVAVSAQVDLSADGAPRDAGQETPEPYISLPHRLIRLHLVLPYYSPTGTYRVTVVKDRNESSTRAEASGSAVAQGSRTEVQVTLDLRRVDPGKYYLGTANVGDGVPYYYPLTVNQ
jgi:hypothetical protein